MLNESDRNVHVRMPNGLEIVRYDRQGHWYEESPEQRKRITITQAVDAAMMPGTEIILGEPGGSQFDAKVRRRRAELLTENPC